MQKRSGEDKVNAFMQNVLFYKNDNSCKNFARRIAKSIFANQKCSRYYIWCDREEIARQRLQIVTQLT